MKSKWKKPPKNFKPKPRIIRDIDDLLDDIVSKYIRLRDEKCVQRGQGGCWGVLTCGHVFSRNGKSTRWDIAKDGNNHAQCWGHNRAETEDNKPYRNWYKQKFGEEKFKELERRYWKPKYWSLKEKKELLQYVQVKYANLKKKKGINRDY